MHAIMLHEECYTEFKEASQLPSDRDRHMGLEKLVSKLGIQDENAEERAERKQWDAKAMLRFLKERAQDWVALPR